MRIRARYSGGSRAGGFTFAETMIASAVVGLLVLANLGSLYHMRIRARKDTECGVVAGFMQHYVELVRAMPFSQVNTNQPLSALYSGSGGTVRVAIPASSSWESINTTAYQTFHPPLVWMTNRNPELRVTYTTTTTGGSLHDKHLALEVRWDPPLGRGMKLQRRLDVFRVKDL